MTSSQIVDVIEKLLKERGIAKSDFYKACGISSSVFSYWRLGRNFPSRSNLNAINKFLGTNFGVISDIPTKTEKTAPITQDGLTDAQKALLEAIPRLSDDVVRFLLQTADTLEAYRKSQGEK